MNFDLTIVNFWKEACNLAQMSTILKTTNLEKEPFQKIARSNMAAILTQVTQNDLFEDIYRASNT